VNEYGARLQSDHSGRFGHFASIPLPDTDGCLREIEYAFDTLKADGICLMTSYGDKLPGDPAFAPVFEELNRRKAVVFFHPIAPTYCSIKFANMTPTLLEYPFDTTRAITSLLYSGTLSQRPDIRFIFSHGGGATPMVAFRINHTARTNKEVAARLPNGSEYELKKLYYETAQAANPVAIAALLKMVPSTQVLFGSDTPYWTIGPFVQDLHAQGLSEADLANIERNTAYRLIPRLNS
jgi:6-methylsalicylate decarboxylase